MQRRRTAYGISQPSGSSKKVPSKKKIETLTAQIAALKVIILANMLPVLLQTLCKMKWRDLLHAPENTAKIELWDRKIARSELAAAAAVIGDGQRWCVFRMR